MIIYENAAYEVENNDSIDDTAYIHKGATLIFPGRVVTFSKGCFLHVLGEDPDHESSLQLPEGGLLLGILDYLLNQGIIEQT